MSGCAALFILLEFGWSLFITMGGGISEFPEFKTEQTFIKQRQVKPKHYPINAMPKTVPDRIANIVSDDINKPTLSI